jgi:hypothetical protein
MRSSIEKRYVDIKKTIDGVKTDLPFPKSKTPFKPLGVLNLPYLEDDGFYQKELSSFLIQLDRVYSFMLLVAFALLPVLLYY